MTRGVPGLPSLRTVCNAVRRPALWAQPFRCVDTVLLERTALGELAVGAAEAAVRLRAAAAALEAILIVVGAHRSRRDRHDGQ